ncbi:MAG: hypothetical protein K2L34_15575 [Muribaculaceae bacterium]|nr:hypothetical protein [Muribaculaceae bacterium]
MKKLLLLSALFPLAAFAQQNEIVEPVDTIPLYDVLHQNAPHFMNIPDVPRFALLGKEHKFYMGIGANVKAVGVYDAGNPIADPNSFVTSAIPMTVAPGNGGKFSLSAQQTNFYINVVALPNTKNQLGAYVDIAFVGENYAPKLNHAYLKYRDITAGYTFSIFSDAAAAPTTIDWQGINAYTGAKMGMVSYQPRFGKNKEWGIGVGLDMPNLSLTNADKTTTVNQRVPNIPFYVQRSWADNKGWLRFSGLIRNLYYRDLNTDKNVDKIGWGVKASGKTPIYGGLSGMYQAAYGKGIASYIQDLGGTGMDLMPDPNNAGELKPVGVWAGYAGLQYDFNSRVSSTVAYGHVRTYAKDFHDSSADWDNGYKYAQYIVGNVFWNVNSIVQVGAEYLYGRRVNYDGRQAHDNRVELQLQVSF